MRQTRNDRKYSAIRIALGRWSTCSLVVVSTLVFGGIAIGQTPADTAQALRNQIFAAYNAGLPSVTIAPGNYEVASSGGNVILDLNGLDDFTIHADGVQLIAKELKQIVRINNANNLAVNGLTVDYDPLPFTQGRVISTNNNNSRFVVDVHDGFDLYAGSTRAILYDAATSEVKRGSKTRFGFDVAPGAAAGQLVVTGRGFLDTLAVGDLVTLTREADIQIPHAIRVTDSTGVTMTDVTVHASTSFGLFESGGGNNTYLGYTATPGPAPTANGPARLLSANADALHSKHTSVGPQIHQATIRAQGDDGIAINGSYLPIGQNNGGGNTITVAARSGGIDDHLFIGDTIRIFDAATGGTVEAAVTGIAPENNVDWAAVRAQHFPNLNTNSNTYTNGYSLTLDRSVAVDPGDFLANPDRNGNGFSVTESTIENHRARGILVKASGGVIENNVVDGSSIAGIVLSAEPYLWLESDFSDDVQIVGNTVRNTGYDSDDPNNTKAGAISVTGPSAWNGTGHANIVIDENVVDSVVGTNLVVNIADGVDVRNNQFLNPNASFTIAGQATGVDPNAVVWVGDAEGVTFTENTVVNPGVANSALIRISDDTGSTTNRFGGVRETHDDSVQIVADYRGDFSAPVAASGWSYLWNANGDIGNPSDYVALQPTANGDYTSDGQPVPSSAPASFLRLGPTSVHPGFGSFQSDRDYYAIAAYAVQTDGEYFIRDSLIQTSADTTGIDVMIHVNDGPAIFNDTFGNLSVASLDAALGQLVAGDTIYVAFGPSGTSGFDFATIDFSIAVAVSTAIAGDFDASGRVEQGDLNLVLNNWGSNTFNGDANALPDGGPFDGTIDQNELNAVLNNWGSSGEAAESLAVPEPSIASVLLLGCGLLLTRTGASKRQALGLPSGI
ncbi:MAG: hypothetical protein AAGJ38_00375 [Planctomycetota bacterium]